jgi:uncharacterized surface protein with fasciclin (FAS1) repeats
MIQLTAKERVMGFLKTSKITAKIIFFSFFILMVTACKEEGDEFRTYDEELVTSFLQARPELYSEFMKLVEAAGIDNLLNAYGAYTCFAPTNDAVEAYFAEKGTSIEQLTLKEIKELTFNHILEKEVTSIEFPSGVIGIANMGERFMYFSYGAVDDNRAIYVNEKSRILALDQKVHNGVIHTVDHVIDISKTHLPEIIAAEERFSLFSAALFATGMSDSLRGYEDEGYKQEKWCCYNANGAHSQTLSSPPFHKYGYTAFVESDSTLSLSGINNLADLKAYAAEVYDRMYPEDKNVSDVTDRRNSLNRFVSYHLLNQMEAENEFISNVKEHFFIPGTVICEYRETMCPNTLMEVQSGTLFNKRKDGFAIRIITPNIRSLNGLCHEIDNILVYDEGVENDVLNKRLRMNETSLFPELTTNKLRMFTGLNIYSQQWYALPPGFLKNASFSEESRFELTSCNCFLNYMGDDMQFSGKWDFTFRLPPVPAGTYEVRMGYIPWTERGVSQLYFDGEPCGIPLDMRMNANNPKIGWIADNDTEDNGVENDKMMHNRGYMKGSNVQWGMNRGQIAREGNYIRKIITTKTFDKTEAHYFRAKCVMESSVTNVFHFDYIEFVPTSYLSKEGRD